MNLFAQATNVPNNGASKSADFQPLTRNPQSAEGSLQPGTVPQSTSTQDVLSNENARISVPVGNNKAAAPTATPASSGGVNWLLVIVSAAVIVVALEYVFRRREKSRSPNPELADTTPHEIITLPVEEPVSASISVAEAPKPKPKKKTATKTSAKKKSKSKRKKSRR